jgi:hypothetical protein
MPFASLASLFEMILEPLRTGAHARLWIKLQRREMLEPTGLWQEKLNHGIPRMHESLVALLCGRLGLDRPDDEVQALAISIVGPAVHLLLNCEVIDVLAPQLLAGTEAVNRWRERLLAGAEAMISAERKRRIRAGKKAGGDKNRPTIRRPKAASMSSTRTTGTRV